MNLDELRTVQAKERRKDSLQHLRDAFYEDVAAYVEGLKAERQRAAERTDDPFSSPEVGRLTDEIETAEEVVEAVYERRVGKVVKLASFAAADMPVDEDGMTTQERELFEDLVERIKGNKSAVLDILAGKRAPEPVGEDGPRNADATGEAAPGELADAGAPSTEDAEPDVDAPTGGVLGDAMGGSDSGSADRPTEKPDAPSPTDGEASGGSDASGARLDADGTTTGSEGDGSGVSGGPSGPGESVPEARPADAAEAARDGATDTTDAADATSTTDATGESGESLDRTTVRITRDVGEIFGVDERAYDLASEDVVTLPTANAEPLVQRDAAEKLD